MVAWTGELEWEEVKRSDSVYNLQVKPTRFADRVCVYERERETEREGGRGWG